MASCPLCSAPTDDLAELCGRCGKVIPLVTGVVLASRYEILGHIGRGGMGSVYRARDRMLNEVVALKTLRADIASSPEMAHRFISEIKLARRVGHKNVCRIFEYGEERHLHFIAMEYIEGVDLRRVIQQHGAFPAAEGFDIALQIAGGLDAIHDLGVIHRDLKTSNLMRDRRGVIKLMDFGIAKEWGVEGATHATQTGTAVGTPEYMSPEQAQGEKVDFRSDIYSFGVVLFELFTGDVPFRGTTPMATALQHIQQPPPLDGPRAAAIPPALIPVLRIALAKQASERYQSVSAMGDALRDARSASATEPALAVPSATLATQTRLEPTVHPVPPPPPPTPLPVATETYRTPPRRTPAQSRPARSVVPPVPPRPVRPGGEARAASGSRLWLWVGVAAVVALVAAVAGLALFRTPRAPEAESAEPTPLPIVIAAPPPAAATAGRSEGHDASNIAVATPTLRPTDAPRAAATPMPAPPALATSYVPRVAPTPRATPTAVPVPMARETARLTLRPATPTPLPEPARPVATPPAPAAAEATQSGMLKLLVVPWAEVEIDGKAVGTTPLKPIVLPPGTHSVRLRHPEYRPLMRRVEIKAAQTTRVEINLKEEAFRASAPSAGTR